MLFLNPQNADCTLSSFSLLNLDVLLIYTHHIPLNLFRLSLLPFHYFLDFILFGLFLFLGPVVAQIGFTFTLDLLDPYSFLSAIWSHLGSLSKVDPFPSRIRDMQLSIEKATC